MKHRGVAHPIRTVGRMLLIMLIVAASFVAMSTPVSAATVYKSGTIAADETWTSSNVYVVNGNLTVANGVTLTIQAGTVVKFERCTTMISSVDGVWTCRGHRAILWCSPRSRTMPTGVTRMGMG